MTDVDRQLVADRVKVPGRPLAAMQRVGPELGIEIIVAGPDPSGIGTAISEWFEQRYGDRLKVDLSPGRAVVFIRGDPLVMRLPRIVGTWDGILNVTKLIDGLTQPMFAEMSSGEMQDLVAALPWLREKFDRIGFLPSALRANLDMAVAQMVAQTPHYGESKWASLQFAEKALKHFIRKRGQMPVHTHDLQKLLSTAERLGMAPGRWPLLKAIQCPASVRYDDGVDLDDAALAHHASIDLVAFVAEQLDMEPEKSRAKQARAELADIVLSFEYGIETSHDGNLLFSLVMADGRERRLLFAAGHCLWLRDAILRSMANGRHPDQRLCFDQGRDLRNAPPRHALRLFEIHRPGFGSEDFESPLDQIAVLKAYDRDDCVTLEFSFTSGTGGRLIILSELVSVFAGALSGGIEEGSTRNLFTGRLVGPVQATES